MRYLGNKKKLLYILEDFLTSKKLAELSYNHELKSKANDSSYITEHYNELIEEYNRIDNVIKKYI